MDISLETSFDDSETLLVLAVQSFVQSNGSSSSIEALSKHQSSNWSCAMTERFMTFLRNNIEELRHVGDVLKLLNHLMDRWLDTTIYSSMVYEENEEGFSVLTILTDWMLTNHCAATEPVVAKIWLALERLQTTVSWQRHAEDAWWVESSPTVEWLSLAKRAVKSAVVEINDAEVYCGNLSLLASLLQYHVCDWTTSLAADDMKRLVDALLSHCHTWQFESIHETSSTSLRIGLLSMRLLSVLSKQIADDDISQDFDNMTNATSLVENVLQVAFPVQESAIRDPSMDVLRPLARNVVYSWNQEDGEAWACVLSFERYWGTFLLNSWKRLEDQDFELETIQGMFLLHKICPMQSRSVIEGNTFVTPLISICHQDDNVQTAGYGAALLYLLLGDSRDQDGISCITLDELEQHGKLPALLMKLVHSGTRATVQSLLVSVVDIMDVILRTSRSSFLSTKETETLIDLMNLQPQGDMDLEEDTPQTNNLSRIVDESCLGLGGAVTEKRNHGMDSLVGVAAATAVARLSVCTKIDGSMNARIQSVMHDYVDGFPERNKNICFDIHRRSFRLKILIATMSEDEEEMIATTQWKRFDCHREQLSCKDAQMQQHRKQIDQLSDKIKALVTEKSQLQLKLKSQAVSFQRHFNRSRKGAKVEASRLIERHVQERTKAESQLAEAVYRLEVVKSKEAEAQEIVMECRTSEEKLKGALQVERGNVVVLENALREREAKNQSMAEKVSSLQSKLETAEDDAGQKESELKAFAQRLEEKEVHVQQFKEAHEEIAVELDSAFEKLILLAQAFESKEEEMEELARKSDRSVRNTKRKLDNEIQRNDDLEEELSSFKRDYDRVSKKYERAKQILEKERQDRTEEKERRKRSNPVSYINSLHNEASQKSKSVLSSKESTSFDRQRFTGKENSSFYSSTMQSRSRSRSRRYDD